jgi:HSP20 family protein
MNNSEASSEYRSYHSYMRTICGSFQDIDHPDQLSRSPGQAYYMPPTNVIETEKFYTVELAIPGYHRDDLNIKVENDILTIDANPAKKIDCIRLVHREEFFRNAFHCSLLLPENVQDEKIAADYQNGILSIRIPKSRKPIMVKKEIYISQS